jgi:hypothetical protein
MIDLLFHSSHTRVSYSATYEFSTLKKRISYAWFSREGFRFSLRSSTRIIKEASSIVIDSQNRKVNVKERLQRIAKVAQEKSTSCILPNPESNGEISENECSLNNLKSASTFRQNKRKRRA